MLFLFIFFFFKQKTAYEMRISDWSSDVCSSDLVRSGDPDNVEAQAARKYWPALMGSEFRRDQNAGGSNALLNYGYTVMRSCVARSIIGAGLHPAIGLHHHSRDRKRVV